jgi:hypothetical protein
MKYVLCAILCSICALPCLAQRSTPVQVGHSSGAAGDRFGQAVATDGDTMIVGAPSDAVGSNTFQGSAHIYRWTGSGWALEATLTAADGASNDQFGNSVAIFGDTALVGAFSDTVGANSGQGSAYVFTRASGRTTWTQQAKLTAADGAANDNFGASVAVFGDTAIIGARVDDVGSSFDQGSVFVFVRVGATWTQQAMLTAADGEAGDRFASSVACSGETLIVGASSDQVGANALQGSAYVFVRSGATWTQQAKLTVAGGEFNDRFGTSVAISGDTAVVGALGDDVGSNNNQGSAFVFTRSGTAWSLQAQLNASDGAAVDQFGTFVAVSGDTAIVGAPLDDIGANVDQGSAYVFTRSGTTWSEKVRLTATDGAADDRFGTCVALWGDTAFAGADSDDVGANSDQGSAWVFSRVGTKWIGPDLQLLASSGAANDYFGHSVAIEGDTALVGAYSDDVGANTDQGSVYVFTRSGSIWTQQAQLTATGGAAGDRFGFSVALSGDTALVGAYFDDIGVNNDRGSAYVFTRTGATWTQQAQLTATGGAANDQFGISVALSGDTALVGAWLDDVGRNSNQGSAFVFTRSGTTWTQQAQLTASDGAADDVFGFSVALSGDTALVGARGDDLGTNAGQGSAYVFTRSGSIWIQQAQLTATGGAAGDNFGVSVAISGDTALVGAHWDDVGANTDQGSVYVFGRSGTTWTQQAQLTATGGAAGDNFGWSVALSGDMALVGADEDDVGANPAQGSAYVFTRSGTRWNQQAQLTAAGGAEGDRFGMSVALSGDTALVGASLDDVGAASNQGSVWMLDVPANDLALAYNTVTGVSYPTLLAAFLPAANGQQINATEAVWRTAGWIDAFGKTFLLVGGGDVRTPSTCPVTIGGLSVLATPEQSVVEIFGALFVPASQFGAVATDSFRVGSRGFIQLATNAQLVIDAPRAIIESSATIGRGAALDLLGDAVVYGNLNAAIDSEVSASGSLANFGTWTVTGGSIGATMFTNRDALAVSGTSGIFGDFTNEAGATTTITSGRLFVVGSLTNNGTIVGTPCSNCLSTPPNLDVGGDLNLGPAANLNMPFADSLVHVGGNYNNAINSNARYDLSLATLQLEGSGGAAEQTLEVMSKDIGADVAGLDRTLAGHYPIRTLRIGPAMSTVRLVDTHDNDGLGQGACEAIYVDELIIDAGSRLINTSCRIYYNSLTNNGTVDVPGNLVPMTPFCAADYNRDAFLNLDDLGDFITDFYIEPAIPGGVQPAAPTYADVAIGFGTPCPDAGDATPPYATDAYRVFGYRVGFSPDGSNACPLDPMQPFPNLDHLNDFITAYYATFEGGGC